MSETPRPVKASAAQRPIVEGEFLFTDEDFRRVSAMLHATKITPGLAAICSYVRPGCSGTLSRKMFRVAGALVFSSLIFMNSPSLYFAHIESLSMSGNAK